MIGVLVSGEGTNLQALIDDGLPVAAVASNRRDANALNRARAAGIATATFSLDCHASREERDLVMATWLEEHAVELVVLAGYMHLLTPPFLDRFPSRIVNVHPSLLPAFPGARALDDALAAGVETTGVTVHYVDEGLDSGEIIAQEEVPVEPRETLVERIHAVEHRLLPQVVRGLLGTRSRPMRALISVYDKTGLGAFARGLDELGFELVASGGTAAHLQELGIPVTQVQAVTHAPEMLGGRVKTLHPRIHGAILARRDSSDDLSALDEQEIEPFDVVCVNFYPFSSITAKRGARMSDAVEMIDIGGPSMLRAAAKNFAHVAPVSDPEQYERVLADIREHGVVSPDLRRELAATAFAKSASYEASIARWFAEGEGLPDTLSLAFEKVQDLSYGENPHQRAAYYREVGARRPLLSYVEQLHGRELSFNNLHDLSGALMLLREFTLPACVIVKHANPCGVAVAGTIEEAYERAHAADPLSAFGMVCVLNRPVTPALAAEISQQFVDVLFAPDYEEDALDAWKAKPQTRILADRERRAFPADELDYKRIPGGLLVQDRDWDIETRETMTVVAGSVTEEQWGNLLFAWRVCKHVSSNGIVIANDLRTIGIGAGQQSRVDAVLIALEKAQKFDHDVNSAALASDAFFPFADGPEQALARGVTALIQPGGSKRDAEVVEAVERAGAAMVFTGRRHFRH